MAAARFAMLLRLNAARPVHAAATTMWQQPARSMGIFESVMDGYQKKKMTNQEDAMMKLFKAQMEYFTTVDKYDMQAHIVSLQDTAKVSGVDGWQKYLRTKEEQREIEQKLKEVKIAEVLTTEEVSNPAAIDRRAKMRIASDCGMDVPAVNRFLVGFEHAQATHRWVHKRVANGQRLPDTMVEYQNMMMEGGSPGSKRHMKKLMPRRRGRMGGMK